LELTLEKIKNINLYQRKKGYRYSVDALLLENFIHLKNVNNCIDLGTGSGIISLLLAVRYKKAGITAVELQSTLVNLARQNITLNQLNNRIKLVQADIGKLSRIVPAGKADLVVSNPPYRRLRSGRLNNEDERTIARHEVLLTLKSLVSCASRLLKNGGSFCMVHHPERLSEIFNELCLARLEPKRLKVVYSKADTEAKMVLLESIKAGRPGLKIEPPLFLQKHSSSNCKYSF